ncbi:uncharacterized protein LOC128235905 [Mya arenaria]|uniref:uncharacterized protein LOC128235905 n=1 Tax=Mya arenaria TaxID=6604 RepID=UPI0022E64BB3|nr:uncharacterized protein LOC128235905 [Mya arenaria]
MKPDGTQIDSQNDEGKEQSWKKADRWYAANRILKQRTKEGRKEFFLEWSDTKSKPSWEPEDNVKPELIRQFYIKHTRVGKRRKLDWSRLMMLMSFMIFGSTLVSGSPTELQRLNYGVVFESQDPVQLATESWIHTFAIELPESINIVDLTGCSKGPKTCKIVNEVLLEINQVREETEVMISTPSTPLLGLFQRETL